MSSIGAAFGAAVLSTARAEASRSNGAKSRGPRTPEGKARSAQNALKHGLRSQKFVVLGDESPQAFAALESALVEELAPQGALQGLLVARIARAAWRLERAERIEGELFERHAGSDRNLGLALIRDGNGTRAFDTLLRYRGSALAELWRALRLLKALQAEAAAAPPMRDVAADLPPGPQVDAGAGGEVVAPAPPALCEPPIEPEAHTNPGDIDRASAADEPEALGLPDAAAAPGPGARPAGTT